MKVRWTNESLRLRITPSELERLTRDEPVGADLVLPGGGWSVRLEPGGGALEAVWENGTVTVRIPGGELAVLRAPDAEGVYAHRPGFRLLVEKDFPCAHPHADEAMEPATERFTPSAAFRARKARGHAEPPPLPAAGAGGPG